MPPASPKAPFTLPLLVQYCTVLFSYIAPTMPPAIMIEPTYPKLAQFSTIPPFSTPTIAPVPTALEQAMFDCGPITRLRMMPLSERQAKRPTPISASAVLSAVICTVLVFVIVRPSIILWLPSNTPAK